jgi:signal transduction histidine kinase/CheY-like chemotaxis protein/CHASE3 domain sensor protein/HPt (histidine-containing phosphotransfer) domain-containing protein
MHIINPVKKIPVQIKIGLLMIVTVAILSAAGYLSYRNISSIVSSIPIDVNPELRLLSIREISMDLEKAENSIRIFNVTNDTLDLQPYYKVVSEINKKTARLRKECKSDPLLRRQTDTISRLIRQNIINWNELLDLSRNDKVVENLKQLSDSLNTASLITPAAAVETVPDSATTSENAISTDSVASPKRGFFRRLFGRSEKKPVIEQEQVKNEQVKNEEIRNELIKDERINNDLINNLYKIEQKDSIKRQMLMSREALLAKTGNKIKEKFYDLITKMENEVTLRINKKAEAANLLAEKTYQWLLIFSVSGAFLAIVVMFIIIRYVRKTRASQAALERSREEAVKLSRTKELFMANMSHEIRTPVTAISGFTEQLLHEPLDEYTARTLKIIKSSSDHLANIINDILDFSKLQNDKLALEKVHFSIKKITEDVYALFERQAGRNNTGLSCSLSPDTPPVLLGDPYRLKQIMINLVSNAVKFTEQGKVHFSVKSRDKQNGEIDLIVGVTDTGIGIEESKLNLIFEDFTQAEMSTTRKFGGTGLGLSIVKKLVELHKGQIECKSKKNTGTEITCILPYLTGDIKQLSVENPRLIQVPDEIKNLKILIVDDEEYNRLLFKTILRRWNMSFSEAASGMEAIELVKANRFDLLFMDARMPGLDGLKTTQFMREELQITASEMPVICISAASLNEDWERYEKAGMNSFLQKPFTEEMLLTTISIVIRDFRKNSFVPRMNEPRNNSPREGKINLNNLYHIAGDEKFARQMLLTFLETTSGGLREMNEAAFSGKYESVSDCAHKLLPPCRHIGASALCDLLRKIELSIKENAEKFAVEKLIMESGREFEIISTLLKDEIGKIS